MKYQQCQELHQDIKNQIQNKSSCANIINISNDKNFHIAIMSKLFHHYLKKDAQESEKFLVKHKATKSNLLCS